MTIEDLTNVVKPKEIELKEVKESNTSQRSGESNITRGRPDKIESFRGSNFVNKSRSMSRSKVTCWYCKKEGHWR